MKCRRWNSWKRDNLKQKQRCVQSGTQKELQKCVKRFHLSSWNFKTKGFDEGLRVGDNDILWISMDKIIIIVIVVPVSNSK